MSDFSSKNSSNNDSYNFSTGGIFYRFSPGTLGQVGNYFLYISRPSALDPSIPLFDSLLFFNIPPPLFSKDFLVSRFRLAHFFQLFEPSLSSPKKPSNLSLDQLLNNLSDHLSDSNLSFFTPSTPHQKHHLNKLFISSSYVYASKTNSKSRSHYVIKISFEAKVDTNFAINLAKEYLIAQFPNSRFTAAVHQNTHNTHIHVLLLATDIYGKKLSFSFKQFRNLDLGWAKIYARHFGIEKLQQHLDKKQQTLDWKKDKMMGIAHQQPQRVSLLSNSISNSIQQPTSSPQLPLNQHNSQTFNLLEISSKNHSLLSSEHDNSSHIQHNP